jgi:hypothetical protein
MNSDCIIIFQSTHQALKAEKTLKKCNLTGRMIPLPRKFSSNCGLALKINCKMKPQIEAAFLDNSIEYEGIYDLD